MNDRTPWNRRRTRTLLRFGRKQCGPWDHDAHDDPDWQSGGIPDDHDVDVVIAAPAMLVELKGLLGVVGEHLEMGRPLSVEYLRLVEARIADVVEMAEPKGASDGSE